MKEADKLVSPGEKLFYIEEFLNGVNTYIDDSVIRAAVLGRLKIDWEKREVSVDPLKKYRLISVGDRVLGTIFHISGVFGYVQIHFVWSKDEKRWIWLRYKTTGIVYPPFKVNDVSDIYRVGDDIYGVVESLKNRSIHIVIKGKDYGVVKARCKVCRAPLKLVRYDNSSIATLKCTSCRNIEKRKVSRLYGEKIISILKEAKL